MAEWNKQIRHCTGFLPKSSYDLFHSNEPKVNSLMSLTAVNSTTLTWWCTAPGSSNPS